MAKLGVWLCSGVLVLGCGGRAASDGARDGDAGEDAVAGRAAGGSSSGAAGRAPSNGGVPTVGVPASQGTTTLSRWVGAPSAEGDGRLPDVPETLPGNPGSGWDKCHVDEPLSTSQCADCTAARGTDFLVAEDSLEVSIEAQRPQLYFYFEPTQSAEGLWLDLAWLDGVPGGELTLWETDRGCRPVSEGRLFDISRLLEGERGAWASTCIPLDGARKFSGLGLRLGAVGRVGLDAIRFGACR